MSSKSVKKKCQERVSSKSVLSRLSCQGCPAKVSSKSVLQECPARVSRKSVLQECPAKSVQQESAFKSALQDAAAPDDCAIHLHKEKTSIFISALVSVHSALHKVTAFGFVGSIRFSTQFNYVLSQ